MFYSHQLLARKAPLGQIWMAATLHSKINRRKLSKLNIIQICEEILNPAVPMALRLSGILMGGVVIVYQRKVKLLYDDLSRLLAEINEDWKAKSVPDPTVLPRRKLQARKEAITLPDYQEADIEVEDVERSLKYFDANATADFQHTAYFAMRLDTVDDVLINGSAMEGETENLHQADPANITLPEHFDLFQTRTGPFNHFERFDIEGDDDTQLNFASGERTPITTTLVPSPPHHVEFPREAEEIHDQYPDDQPNQPSEERKVDNQDKQKPRLTKRKTRKLPSFLMDHEQTIIPGHLYQSWLQNTSDIVSKGGRKKKRGSIISTMKIAKLMELPPLVLGDCLISETREIQYPAPLMELWMRSNNPHPHDSLPGKRNSPPLPPELSSSSPPSNVGGYFQDLPGFPVEDVQIGGSSRSFVASAEKRRATTVQFPNNNDMAAAAEVFAQGPPPPANFERNGFADAPSFSAGSYGGGGGSAASGFDSSRSNRKRPHSSSRRGSGGLLEPVAEEHIWSKAEPNFVLPRVSENGVSPPDQELLVETEPTQTQPPFAATPVPNKLTETIHTQMKAHFDTPGAPRVESLNNLASGMNRKGAAMLFYQTCVLATRDVLKVEQKVPYGDIFISKGTKM